jgi:hypothetical protein
VKKVNKYSLPLHQNSQPIRPLFCGQTTSSLRPYGRSGQIICIGEKKKSTSNPLEEKKENKKSRHTPSP